MLAVMVCPCTPNVTKESKLVEIATFWPAVLLAAGIGHLIEASMRADFLARKHGVKLKAFRPPSAPYPILVAAVLSFGLVLSASITYVPPYLGAGSISSSSVQASDHNVSMW